MNTRRAACSCGQLQVTIEGDPSRIALCHCLACQRRTGAVISNQARFHRDQVTIFGKSTEWMRTAESGNAMTFHFCPFCGSTVYWENEGFPGCGGCVFAGPGERVDQAGKATLSKNIEAVHYPRDPACCPREQPSPSVQKVTTQDLSGGWRE